ncbi:Disintegrin and metalloproteinase domain-containing protein 11 [Collichthys lucidus]|uniref:Disintegrin and metalloproteinase domain-containing protein 11 n=1 Tax=Collichthys lucidus TaxID=240159 RepID=A0A4U5VU29_COLLU|nr:Disintegrin and metalloproteinase domain-containing protein 11 [Collichthys lucidus]
MKLELHVQKQLCSMAEHNKFEARSKAQQLEADLAFEKTQAQKLQAKLSEVEEAFRKHKEEAKNSRAVASSSCTELHGNGRRRLLEMREGTTVPRVDRSPVQDGGMWDWFTPAGQPDSGDTATKITYPKRLVQQIKSEEEMAHDHLDTRVKNSTGDILPVHLAQSCFQVEAFGRTFTLDLELNHHLLSSEYVERHFNQDGRPSQSVSGEREWRPAGSGMKTCSQARLSLSWMEDSRDASDAAAGQCDAFKAARHQTDLCRQNSFITARCAKGGEHCYYQGRLRGLPESWAALSTCHGLCGMFSDGFFSYGIRACSQRERSDCTEDSEWESRGDDVDDNRLDQMREQQVSGGLRRSKRFVRKPSVQTETKYIELMVVNDNEMFVQLRRSSSQTKNFAKAVVNMADAIYKEQLNTRIVLVAMETWSSQNMIPVEEDPLMTLQNFMKYRKDNIKEQSDVVHLFSGRTFHSSRSGTAYTGGVCSLTRGGGINEYGNVGAMAITLCQSLGQNIGMSVDEYIQFLLQGGGSCLFNKPNKLLDPPECGNGFVEPGEECDCGSQVVSIQLDIMHESQLFNLLQMECARSGGACCKKCTLTHDAMCSNGLCCSGCKYERRGVVCRDAVNDCDIPETCTGDSSQCPHNVHKLDGYMCDNNQGRCYSGRCRTRDGQCRGLWGYNSADRFCYEKLNAEGTEKGNCGPGPEGKGWLQCNKPDVLCGFLFCANVTVKPKFGDLQGEVTSFTLYHQNKYLDCRGGHALLEDGSDLGYVENGTPCGPNMMCLERRCLPVAAFNLSSCSGSNFGRICSDHGTCSNEVKCICDRDYTGKDCSVFDPIPEPTVPTGPEKKGP